MLLSPHGGECLDTINKRFRDVRKSCGKNQEEWGKILGITRPGVSDIESGRRNVTDKHIKLLCSNPIETKHINEEWLRTGEGEMFIEIPEESEFEAAAAQLSKENDVVAMQALIQYWKLDAASRESVRQYIKNLCENIK